MSVSALRDIWESSMKYISSLSVLILLGLSCLPLNAAEEEPLLPADPDDPIIAEARQAAEEAGSEGETGGSDVEDNPAASEDAFTPTIQISEDLSVSFPVDI